MRLFFSEEVPLPSECAVEQCLKSGKFTLKGAASDGRKSLVEVLFDLLFGEGLRRRVPAVPNKLEDDADVGNCLFFLDCSGVNFV